MAEPRRTTTTHSVAMPMIASIAAVFRERRLALRLTQQALADLAGVSRSTIQATEHGNGSVSLRAAGQIAETLGLSLTAAPATIDQQ